MIDSSQNIAVFVPNRIKELSKVIEDLDKQIKKDQNEKKMIMYVENMLESDPVETKKNISILLEQLARLKQYSAYKHELELLTKTNTFMAIERMKITHSYQDSHNQYNKLMDISTRSSIELHCDPNVINPCINCGSYENKCTYIRKCVECESFQPESKCICNGDIYSFCSNCVRDFIVCSWENTTTDIVCYSMCPVCSVSLVVNVFVIFIRVYFVHSIFILLYSRKKTLDLQIPLIC